MIHGAAPEALDAIKARAKQVVTLASARAEGAALSPLLGARYARKAAEAAIVLGGGKSALITAEAAARKVSAHVLATMILDKAAASADLELRRIRTGLQIDAATTAAGVVAALTAAGLTLPDETGAL